MKNSKKQDSPNSSEEPRGIVPDRGSISGSGEGMSDEAALAILRKVEPQTHSEHPDIEVVVGPEVPRAQTEIPIDPPTYGHGSGALAETFGKAVWGTSKFISPLGKLTPSHPRVVIQRTDLNSSIRSVLNQASALRLAEEAFGSGQSLRMRLLLDKSTIDLDLSSSDSDDLEATLSDLIERSID